MVDDQESAINHVRQDSRTGDDVSDVAALAGIVHLLYFAQTVGLIIAVVLWATRGKRSRFLAFQCAQAIILQGIMFIILMVFGVAFGLFMMLSFSVSMSSVDSGENASPWPFFVGFPLFWGSMMLLWLAYLAVGGISVWAAVRCFQARDPWIPGAGSVAARLTGREAMRQ